MLNVIHREFEDHQIIIYKRSTPARQRMDKLYFEFVKFNQQASGLEFKSRSQVVAYLKKTNRI